MIDEAALCRPAVAESTNGSLMARQLEELLAQAAELPNVTIQIMPLRSGFYPAMRGPFVILEFEDAADGHVVYQENPEGSVFYKYDIQRSLYFCQAFTALEITAIALDQLPPR